MSFKLTKEKLYVDLLVAFCDAKKHKSNKEYVKIFERDLEANLNELCESLWNRTYKPEPSSCFIINCPKAREVFAAQFRDRVVHHLLYGYIHEMLERTFIEDAYSCVPDKGTSYGIQRLQKNIIGESNNYSKRVYILKMDVKGYFIHIDRAKLNQITRESIIRMSEHKINNKYNTRWKDVIDIDFCLWLASEIILLDPIKNCVIIGKESDWDPLPDRKSLFKSPDGKGLPIGNLTSQLFSNVYLNLLDQYCKRVLGCKRYGRYVDDLYVVSENKEFLHSIIPKIERFLNDELGLEVSKGKTKICASDYGVDFLGAYIKPHRIYVSNETLRRMHKKTSKLDEKTDDEKFASINSYLGLMRHYSSYNLRREMFENIEGIDRIGHFNDEFTKIVKKKKR